MMRVRKLGLQPLLLSIAILALAAGVVNAQDPTPAPDPEVKEGEMEDRGVFNPRLAIANLVAYQDEHVEFAASIATWITIGTILLILALILFIFSEIQAVLVVRDQDFRRTMLKQSYMDEGASLDELIDYENKTMAPRPIISLFAVCLMYIGLACIFYPLCDILNVVGLPSAPCVLIVTFGSFFTVICIASFWMFVCWSCTRSWAALVFLAISLTGQLLLPTGNPLLLLLWLVISLGGGVGYFYWAPELYRDRERPSWLQTVGDFTISTDVQTILDSLRDKAEVDAEQLKRSVRAKAGLADSKATV
eukprot:CAMPEP_0181319710 /NCGR_PEP_ID=MMETSP1101-20121128/17724_1 /TAXON_ID=46948 /ORGANISM="Rhodomonas abbreviata, Strain Caron Lab Isolate" /LENGTH=305 /DNA_ID=CAMNT_0023427343 /DNA_START=13 /DNA_END=930 /DNA_ORIENTATION=-